MNRVYVDIFSTDKKYSIIYADPPWSYNDSGCSGAAAAQYQTMKIDDICALPIEQIAEKIAFCSCGLPTRNYKKRSS